MFLTKLSTSCPERAGLPSHRRRSTSSCYSPLDSRCSLLYWGDISNHFARFGLSPVCNLLVPSAEITYGSGLFCISLTGEYLIPHIINRHNSCHGACVEFTLE